jgi:hypothetical protein
MSNGPSEYSCCDCQRLVMTILYLALRTRRALCSLSVLVALGNRSLLVD